MNLCAEQVECCNWGCNSCTLDTHQEKIDQIANRSRRFHLVDVFHSPYAKFIVESITKCSSIVLHYRFKFLADAISTDASAQFYLDIPTTYFLLLRAPTTVAAHAKNVREKYDAATEETYISRPYTPLRFNGADLTFELLIKLAPNGSMTKYFESLRVNDVTEWKGVFGSFQWIPNRYKYLVCICQGVAISPIYSLIKDILADEDDETRIILLTCFQNVENIQLRDEQEEFRRYWNYQSRIYLSHEEKCELCAGQKIVNCDCLKDGLRFGEQVRNYRLDTHELVNIYMDLKTNEVYTVFCGIEKLERVILDCFDEIGDKVLSANYFNLE